MKTIRELYDEIMASQELKDQFIEAARAGKQEAFLKEHGCEAAMEEVAAFLKAKAEEDAPLSMDELENSAGGECNDKTKKEIGFSIGLLGIGCAILATASAWVPTKHTGQQAPNEGRLCTGNDGDGFF